MAKRFQISNFRFAISWAKIRATLTSRDLRIKLWHLIVRVYAAAILLTLIWCGYLAVAYLVRTVFYPPAIPLEVQAWPAKLEVAVLRASAAPGVEEPERRAPISHFHHIDQWLQQDNLNGCTISGCHEPLPHDLKSKVPAFANFHATFLACQMCHRPSEARPGNAAWINIRSGKPQDVPAILRLLDYLETNADAITNRPADVQRKITSLLAESITDMGGDPALDDLLSQIQSSEPGSPVWKQAVAWLAAELPEHARGEYRAKLIWSDLASDRDAQYRELTAQAAQLASAADDSQRHDILKGIHAALATEPAKCLACHDERPGMLDFAGVGFSAKRSAYLSNLEIARLMQQIRQGQQFYLPNLEFGQ